MKNAFAYCDSLNRSSDRFPAVGYIHLAPALLMNVQGGWAIIKSQSWLMICSASPLMCHSGCPPLQSWISQLYASWPNSRKALHTAWLSSHATSTLNLLLAHCFPSPVGYWQFLSVFTKDNQFIGSVEVHGLQEKQPELGIWIKREFQKNGYAYEALNNVIKMVNDDFQKEWYVYEADIRNKGSMKLVEKFLYRKEDFDEFTTETGKELKLQRFIIKLR